jgi:uncharacterized coiled-coil protein SlyX
LESNTAIVAAQGQLTQLRLQGAIAIAQAEEDIGKAARLTVDLAEATVEATAQELAGKQRNQALSERITKLDSQRAIQAAEIAAIEAEIAIRKAQAEGATQEEINNLKSIYDLRLDQLDSAKDSATITDQVLANQRELLGIEEDIAGEQLKQNQLTEARNNLTEAGNRLAEARKGIISALAAESNTSVEDSLASLDRIGDRFKTAQQAGLFEGEDVRDAIGDVRRALRRNNDERLIELAQQDNPLITQLLNAAGRSDITGLVEADRELDLAKAIQDGNALIVQRLDTLIAQGLGARIEQLNVSTPDPVADTSRIVADIAKLQTAGVNA